MKVLVIEDSLVVRRYVCAVLASEPDFQIIEAGDGESGLERARSEQPDVVLTDLKLPGLGGIEVIKAIMRERPRPIIVLSGHLHDTEKDLAFEAFDAGAVEVLAKPTGFEQMHQDRFRSMLVKTVRLMARVPVVGRRVPQPARDDAAVEAPDVHVEVVVIGASTGGPPLLQDMLASFAVPLRVPIVVVQHIVPGFEFSFAQWLGQTGQDVRVAAHAEPMIAGRIYIAPASSDIRLAQTGALELVPHSTGRTAATSIDTLFESVAERCGPQAWGILLTGMGMDGAAGLLKMKQSGAFTITQDSESCTIDGMPAAARRLGAATKTMKPGEIWAAIRTCFGSEKVEMSS